MTFTSCFFARRSIFGRFYLWVFPKLPEPRRSPFSTRGAPISIRRMASFRLRHLLGGHLRNGDRSEKGHPCEIADGPLMPSETSSPMMPGRSKQSRQQVPSNLWWHCFVAVAEQNGYRLLDPSLDAQHWPCIHASLAQRTADRGCWASGPSIFFRTSLQTTPI